MKINFIFKKFEVAAKNARKRAEKLRRLVLGIDSSMVAANHRRWIVDSGSCFDLVDARALTDTERRHIAKGCAQKTLMTANGEMTVDNEINIEVSGIGEVENALVMPECPSVLLLCRLCVEKGYTFHWAAGKSPTLTNSRGNTIALKVERFVPILAAQHVAAASPEKQAHSEPQQAVSRSESSAPASGQTKSVTPRTGNSSSESSAVDNGIQFTTSEDVDQLFR